MLAFSLAARRWVLVLLLVALATVWGLVKFSAVVGIYLCLGYFLFVSIVSGRSYGRNTVLVFAVSTFVHIAVVAGVYVFYLDQSPLYFLDYIDRSFEIAQGYRSEEHPSELQSLMRISYAVSCLKNKNNTYINT